MKGKASRRESGERQGKLFLHVCPLPHLLVVVARLPMSSMHYHSRRSAIYATNGCIATSQPLATSIGLQILREHGGNAADASIAIAAALAVLEPCSTGLGGDMMAMHYDASTHKVSAVNGSGRSPAALPLDAVLQTQSVCEFRNRVGPSYRHSSITSYSNDLTAAAAATTFETGVDTITVPGAAQGWEDVHRKFGSGRLTLSQLLEPAARLAECGFPVSTMTSKHWSDSMNIITRWYTPDEIMYGKVELSVDGRGTGPKPGQLFRNVGMANVLRQLGEKGAKEGFYGGSPGRAIVDAIQRHGGSMTLTDLTNHSSTFVQPIHVEYQGMNVWEVPPNGQGVAGLIALEGLNALEKNGLVKSSSSSFNEDESLLSHRSHPPQTSVDMLHAQIEMMRLGFGDARAHVCDPDLATNDKSQIDWLLNKERIHKRALDSFNVEKAVIHGSPDSTSCTVSFQVVDNDGNAISFVNSNYMGFGTGLIPTNCGFTLQNRGAGFSLDPDHPNALGPSKRPYHTIIPAILTHADTGELYATLTNMGGYMQPQGHLQLVVNLLTYGMDPQTAIAAPRFCIGDGTLDGTVLIEEGFHPDTIAKMEMMGHKMNANRLGHDRHWFGRAQIITRDRDTGVLCAGSDGRADGCALGY